MCVIYLYSSPIIDSTHIEYVCVHYTALVYFQLYNFVFANNKPFIVTYPRNEEERISQMRYSECCYIEAAVRGKAVGHIVVLRMGHDSDKYVSPTTSRLDSCSQ